MSDNKPLAVQKNISLELTPVPPNLPHVLADPIRINEVLNNLISNALKHTKSGGWVKISTSVQGTEMVTSVSDNGEGIPKEALPHLFTKFYRVPGSLDKMKEGTGLGLFLAKSIIDMHKGRIWVESEVGKGSTFYFSIPVATQTSTIANIVSG
jgi:two-component system phosphate regulon sensor histidine kinase PhoR